MQKNFEAAVVSCVCDLNGATKATGLESAKNRPIDLSRAAQATLGNIVLELKFEN